VMEHYGIDHLREVIRDQVALAQRFTAELQKRNDIELLAPQMFSVIVFRKKGSDEANAELLERINASGKLFVSHTKLKGRYGIRVAIGNGATEWKHVAQILDFL
jgi:aromatic-L-amino-acid/L-tryptophan decarboxylase